MVNQPTFATGRCRARSRPGAMTLHIDANRRAVPKNSAIARAKPMSRISCTPHGRPPHLTEQHPGGLVSSDTDRNPAVQRCRVPGARPAGRRHACHLAPCTRLLDHFRSVAYSTSSDAHGRTTCLPAQGYRLPATVLGQAMFMSSSRIRHDTPSTARW
ncbi:pstA domain protein [Mycobacterium xenopi 4042]|uniref:PstA domain protein n=1 Tax=Mycobacterium xenopi 4042 TaxID=1299334 RepID=X7ZDX1_MYCXE|nr:pstA domain protein [Mycobacterium xenopi 4042]